MQANGDRSIDDLVGTQRIGCSLDRPFYSDAGIFERDRERVFRNHWVLAAHVSQFERTGDYRLFDFAGESIILVRGREGDIRAHFNVCRHRGSRVMLEPCGNAAALTCRYHGWTYALDGSLRAAQHMPEDFERSRYGLKPCHVRNLEGLLFVCIAGDRPPDFNAIAEGLQPYLLLHGTAAARVALQRTFPVHANWKLVVENYLECYHCKPAHREYCTVEIKADSIGDGSPAALARYAAREREWRVHADRLGTLLPEVGTSLPLDARLATTPIMAAYRAPLRASHVTATENGRPAAPLMGRFPEYDGGETALAADPLTYMLAYNDYAVFFAFVPRDSDHTDIVCTWLVHGKARADKDYDLARLTWLWMATTDQDKAIVEANAAGVRSPSYQPGPVSLLEADVAAFREWYLSSIGPASRPSRLNDVSGGRYFKT
ncbi:MAG: aromatic ring-hydroxylating oxygenase subunit alpha [Gammaproteobacteria bacterium]